MALAIASLRAALSGMVALTLVGCGESQSDAPEIRPVRTVVVDPKPIDDDRRAVGEVRPRRESDLGFLVSGKVVSRLVDVGVTVKKDDLLARLDEQDYQNRLKSAEADLASAEAGLAEAQSSEERLKQLVATNTTSRANYDTALRNLRAAEARLEQTRAAAALARDQVRYAVLKAPFDGIVTAVGAEPGQVVAVGQMVVRLAVPDEKDAVFSIAESAFRDRKPGDRPQIAVTLLSSPNVTADGVVREISPVADPATRTFQVKVTLNDPPLQMRFGSSVVGRLKERTAPVVVLPGSALFDKGGAPAVWRVKMKDEAVGIVELRPVTVARYEADQVVLSEGLQKGDIVVTAGVNRLRANQTVRLLERATAEADKR